MKKRGQDFAIGLIVGVILILLLTHHGGNTKAPSHPASSPTASTSASPSPSRHTTKAHAAATQKAKPHVTVHPTPVAHVSKPTSHKPADSGVGNGVIAIASLVTIAASLSTVTMTVHGLRAVR